MPEHLKKHAWLLLLASLWTVPLLAQGKMMLSTFIRDTLAQRSKDILAAAAEMPADKYAFKATPEEMNFGQLMLHVAVGNYLYCSKIGGVPEPQLPDVSDTNPKDKLTERLKASFDFCTTALAKLDDSSIGETLTLGETQSSRAMAILTLSGSWSQHYDMLTNDLQLNGRPPPTAAK